jgi:hypothetical protein
LSAEARGSIPASPTIDHRSAILTPADSVAIGVVPTEPSEGPTPAFQSQRGFVLVCAAAGAAEAATLMIIRSTKDIGRMISSECGAGDGRAGCHGRHRRHGRYRVVQGALSASGDHGARTADAVRRDTSGSQTHGAAPEA